MPFPQLLEIVLEKDNEDFKVVEQYEYRGCGPSRSPVAKFSLFGKVKGYNVLEIQEAWDDGPCMGVSRKPIDLVPEDQDLQSRKYQVALAYATDLATRNEVRLVDNSKS